MAQQTISKKLRGRRSKGRVSGPGQDVRKPEARFEVDVDALRARIEQPMAELDRRVAEIDKEPQGRGIEELPTRLDFAVQQVRIAEEQSFRLASQSLRQAVANMPRPNEKGVGEPSAAVDVFTSDHIRVLAKYIALFLRRDWFVSSLHPTNSDHFMATLLMSVCSSFLEGHPLHKKKAWELMGVEDIKTGRKYIAQAEEFGLLNVVRSPSDKRRELLHPTPTLLTSLSEELASFVRDLDALSQELSDVSQSKPTILADEIGAISNRNVRKQKASR